MSSGLSMTSVNKIKELAEAKEYSLAVEILDSQDLERSWNPQFLRVCGEVYENVGRSTDARNMYVKAHVMGPESNRILFSLISLYLKRGYFGLAERYAEQYKFNAKGAEQELKNIEYIIKKAEHSELSLLQGYLDPYYSHNMDEEWSFELFLLQTIQGLDTDMLASDYKATFRRSIRSEQIQSILDGEVSAEDLFWIYADAEHQDKDPAEEEIRALEAEQLKKDYIRMHPSVAETVEESDDVAEIDPASAEILDNPDTEQKFKSFLKRKFRKKPKEDEEEKDDTEKQETDAEGGDTADQEEGKEAAETEGSLPDAESEKPAEEETEPEKPEKVTEAKKPEADEASAGPAPTGRVKGFVSQLADRGRNKNEMQEITPDPLDDVLSYDFDDGFAAESDTISDLAESEKESYQNPFDLINAYKITEKEKKDVQKAYGQVPKELKDTIDESKRAAEAAAEQAREEAPEPMAEDEAEVSWSEPELTEEPEPIEEPMAEEEPILEETEGEEIPWSEPEEEPVEEEEIPWSEPEEESVEEEPIEEPVVEEEPILEETEGEEIPWSEPEEAEEEPVEEEPIEEPIVEEEPMAEEGLEEEEIPWSEPEEAEEEEPVEEPEEEPVEEEPMAEEEPEEEEIPWSEPKPAFDENVKSATPKKPVKTAFDVMMEKESEKLDEGLAEEERLQKEAEALLASLGIKL